MNDEKIRNKIAPVAFHVWKRAREVLQSKSSQDEAVRLNLHQVIGFFLLRDRSDRFCVLGLVSNGLCMAKQGMTTRDEAVEQLRVIRSMMERATIFRALSGETALVGGAISLGVAWYSERCKGMDWARTWLYGLAVVLAFHVFQLYRMKTTHQRPFWTYGLRTALRGALPSLIVGGFLGVLFVWSGNNLAAAGIWICHYGLALLAIREFAPKSMTWLGWAFVVFGLLSLATVAQIVEIDRMWMMHVNPSRLMAFTFGGFHLIYGGLIVTTGRREETHA